jgi:hypothetical protein
LVDNATLNHQETEEIIRYISNFFGNILGVGVKYAEARADKSVA